MPTTVLVWILQHYQYTGRGLAEHSATRTSHNTVAIAIWLLQQLQYIYKVGVSLAGCDYRRYHY